MAVRVEVKLKALKGRNKEKETIRVALLNLGYESDVPEIIVPLDVARELGFLPELPPDARMEEYYSVSGKFTARKIPSAVEIDLMGRKLTADVVISDFEREVLLSDATVSAFGIIIEEAKAGKWRFRE
jgi:hypothetical protein